MIKEKKSDITKDKKNIVLGLTFLHALIRSIISHFLLFLFETKIKKNSGVEFNLEV